MNCRKNVKNLTSEEKRRFIAAVAALRDAKLHPSITHPGLQSRYDDFTRMRALAAMAREHAPSAISVAGGPPPVFPWHRELVNRFENELQAIDPTVTVPYCDSRTYAVTDPSETFAAARGLSSPSDLTFWLSHANVDRLWSIWEARQSEQAGGNPGGATHAKGRTVYGKRVWYDSDLPETTLETSHISFGDVPEGLTTYRAARFRIKTYREVRLRVTNAPANSPFGFPMGSEFVVQPNDDADQVNGFVWVSFSATGATPIGTIVVQPFVTDVDGEYTGMPNREIPVGPALTVDLSATIVPYIGNSQSLVIHRPVARATRAVRATR